MEKNFLSSITKNKHIKEIITELNLNEDQILSAYPYFFISRIRIRVSTCFVLKVKSPDIIQP